MDERTYKRIINAWAMYDWANSAFAAVIMATVLPVFYSKVAAATIHPDPERARVLASSAWGYTNTIAMLIIAFSAPILGALADHSGAKKKFLGAFASLGITATALLYFVSTGDWLAASLFYILGRVGFSGANIFYDSLLPHIARKEDIDYVSAKGYALGYLGGGLLLALSLAWIMKPEMFGFPNSEMATRVSFIAVAVWWAVFSIPLFKYVPEPPHALERGESRQHPIKAAFQRLQNTFREIRRYTELFKFLLAFWLYNDGIGTIITMATIYGAEIGIRDVDLIGAILMVQFLGIPFSLAFGWLGKRIGAKRAILLALGVYTLIAIGGYFMREGWHFWLLAVLVATVQGGAQALSRSLYGVMTPKAKSAEFFGFYNVSSKFAGIVGPAFFAFVGSMAGSSRLSIVALVIFFIGGALLLLRVDVEKGIRVAREEDAALGLA
ncbi:MAG: MFS transporter [Chloroflexi bacterium]|nr:MFS transporter [Chloroflexota bacterium]